MEIIREIKCHVMKGLGRWLPSQFEGMTQDNVINQSDCLNVVLQMSGLKS